MPAIFQALCNRNQVFRSEEVGFLAYLPLSTPSFASFPLFNLSSLPVYSPTYFQLFLYYSYFIRSLQSYHFTLILILLTHTHTHTHLLSSTWFSIPFGAIILNKGGWIFKLGERILSHALCVCVRACVFVSKDHTHWVCIQWWICNRLLNSYIWTVYLFAFYPLCTRLTALEICLFLFLLSTYFAPPRSHSTTLWGLDSVQETETTLGVLNWREFNIGNWVLTKICLKICGVDS